MISFLIGLRYLGCLLFKHYGLFHVLVYNYEESRKVYAIHRLFETVWVGVCRRWCLVLEEGHLFQICKYIYKQSYAMQDNQYLHVLVL